MAGRHRPCIVVSGTPIQSKFSLSWLDAFWPGNGVVLVATGAGGNFLLHLYASKLHFPPARCRPNTCPPDLGVWARLINLCESNTILSTKSHS